MKRLALAVALVIATAGVVAWSQGYESTATTLVQAANVTTASDGTFAVTWKTAFNTVMPFVAPHYIGAATTQPITCLPVTSTATGMTGKCYAGQSTLLTLSIITTGLTLAPFVAAAGGITVQVLGRDVTQ